MIGWRKKIELRDPQQIGMIVADPMLRLRRRNPKNRAKKHRSTGTP
jgi:hypothetical protein